MGGSALGSRPLRSMRRTRNKEHDCLRLRRESRISLELTPLVTRRTHLKVGEKQRELFAHRPAHKNQDGDHAGGDLNTGTDGDTESHLDLALEREQNGGGVLGCEDNCSEPNPFDMAL